MRHRVRIERRTEPTKDSYGEPLPVYVPLATVWARVQDESQREYVAALHLQDQKTISIQIRDPQISPAIKPKDRVVWLLPSGERPLDIKAILAGENIQGGLITLACVEHSET